MNEELGLDWVTARAQCSVARAFITLLAGVRKDVAIRNALLATSGGARFEVVEASGNDFSVFQQVAGGQVRQVRFECDESMVMIRGPKGYFLRLSLTIDFSGFCRFVTEEGDRLDSWQVRKLALEDLFFGS